MGVLFCEMRNIKGQNSLTSLYVAKSLTFTIYSEQNSKGKGCWVITTTEKFRQMLRYRLYQENETKTSLFFKSI